MGTTAQKLNKILETKEAIRTAINNKGGTLTTTDTFASYPSAIDSLPSGGGGTTLKNLFDNTKRCSYLFKNQANLTSIGEDLINYNDTENVEWASYMFDNCQKLETLPELNMINLKGADYYCNSCYKLKKVKLNPNNLQTLMYAFKDCYKLTEVDINMLPETNNQQYLYQSFYNCYSLQKLIIRTMNQIPILYGNITFYNCYYFTGTINETYNPTGAYGAIYVPDDKVEELKVATNWSLYASAIKPLSELVKE